MSDSKKTAYSGLTLLGGTVAIAAIVWFFLFVVIKTGPAYWILMCSATLTLGGFTFFIYPDTMKASPVGWMKYMLWGIVAAAVLYGAFFLGNILVKQITFLIPSGPQDVQNVYATGHGISPRLLLMILLFPIGPGEELFWRGFVQRTLMIRLGTWKGFWVTLLLYTAIHLPAMNLPLLGAAAVAGGIWGLMYIKFRHIGPGVVSHALWDAVVFVIFPFS